LGGLRRGHSVEAAPSGGQGDGRNGACGALQQHPAATLHQSVNDAVLTLRSIEAGQQKTNRLLEQLLAKQK
jgi:hypothetical protein